MKKFIIKKWLRAYHYKKIWKFTDRRLKYSGMPANTESRKLKMAKRVRKNEKKITYHHKRWTELNKEIEG